MMRGASASAVNQRINGSHEASEVEAELASELLNVARSVKWW
uniref:Uncharacterized protein n=1 Tax=Lotus japonicus TaxID=34305 RepID=I3SPQ6_LOTJA|nr:unknown [Lotus japonicus]